MGYSANTEKPVQPTGTFVILRPKRRVEDWTLADTNTWVADFDHGHITRVVIDGVDYNSQSTLPLSSATYKWDKDAQKLYIYSASDPDTLGLFVIAHYELYISDRDRVWHRDPTDPDSDEVFWEGMLISTPSWSQFMSDILFGFFPIDATSVSFANTGHFFDRHSYDSSWKNSTVRIYHLLGDEDTANIRMIYMGFGGNYRWSERGTFDLSLENVFRILDNKYSTQKWFDSTNFPSIDPDAVQSGQEYPIRKVYGMMDGFYPVNVDYGDPATTTNNRDWVVSQGQSNVATLVMNIDIGAANSATQTFFDTVDGVNIGDWVYLEQSLAGNMAVKVVTVDYVNKKITHASVGARSFLIGDTGTRYFIGAVTIVDTNGVATELEPGNHWTVGNFANNSKGFTLVDNFEASAGVGTFDPRQNQLSCRVYGETYIFDYEVAATPVTTANQRGGNLNNIAATIYAFLRECKGIEDFDIDEDSLAAAVSGRTDLIGFSIPQEREQHDYPTYKDLLTPLLATGLMRMQINDFNGLPSFGISLVGPLQSVADLSVDSSQFRGFEFSVDYADVYSWVRLKFAVSDVYAPFPLSLRTNVFDKSAYFQIDSQSDESGVAKYLHGISRPLVIESLHIDSQEAGAYAERVQWIMSERRATVSLQGKNDFILSELGETVQVDRLALPGYTFDKDTIRSRKFVLAETGKSPLSVDVRLDDQKGIEDNSGGW